MRNIQIILNAILSKNVFEYILVDRELNVINASDGVEKYLDGTPREGDDVLDYLPELVGSEEEIKKIFVKKFCLFSLESIHKNEYYVNITIEYCDQNTAIILLHNVTAMTVSKQNLLQYSNESSLLYHTLQKVVDSQNALIFVTDSNRIKFANKKFMDYFNAEDIESIRSKELNLYRVFDKRLTNYDALFDHTKDREEYIKIDNDTFIMQSTLVESTHKLFTLTKVTTLSRKTELDGLTGAYRKSYFNTQFEKVVNEAGKCVLIVIDLDNFKQVNDTYGHQVGDHILQEFATLVKCNIRKSDMFARWGGEEFLLLFEDSSLKDALDKVESVRRAIDEYSFYETGHLTASFGIASLKENETASSLLCRADKALYEAKANGKNQVVLKKD